MAVHTSKEFVNNTVVIVKSTALILYTQNQNYNIIS